MQGLQVRPQGLDLQLAECEGSLPLPHCTAPGAQLWLSSPLHGSHQLCIGHPRGLISAQERGDETVVGWGTPSHSDRGGIRWLQLGLECSACGSRDQQEQTGMPVAVLQKLAPDCGIHSSGGPTQAPKKPWAVACVHLQDPQWQWQQPCCGQGLPLVSEIAAQLRATPWAPVGGAQPPVVTEKRVPPLSLSSCLIHNPPHSGCGVSRPCWGSRVPAAGGSLDSPLTSHKCCQPVAKSCPTPYDPMDRSTPGSSVLTLSLLEFSQTCVH